MSTVNTSSWLMFTIIEITCLANSCAIWQYDNFSSSLCNLASYLSHESAQCHEFLQPAMFSVNSHNDLAHKFHIQFIVKFTYCGRLAILIKSTSRVIGIYIIYGLIHWLLREGLGLGTKNFNSCHAQHIVGHKYIHQFSIILQHLRAIGSCMFYFLAQWPIHPVYLIPRLLMSWRHNQRMACATMILT